MDILVKITKEIKWRNYHKGVIWLVIAIIGLWSIDHLAWTGLSGYSLRRLGALFTVAASVWGSYRVTRDVLHIDPSEHTNQTAKAVSQLARAIIVAGFAIAVCVSV